MEAQSGKHWLDYIAFGLSVLAVMLSGASWLTSRHTAEAALVPHITVSNLNLAAPSEGDTAPNVVFELRNTGAARATDIQVAMVVFDGASHYLPIAAYVPSLDPGDEPVEDWVPLRFEPQRSLGDYAKFKTPLEITIEITSDSKWEHGYHACSVFELSHPDGRLTRRSGCEPDTIERMKRMGQLPK